MTETTKKPSDVLAEEIVSKFIEQHLVSETRKSELVRKIGAGTMKEEDWLVILDMSAGENRDAKQN